MADRVEERLGKLETRAEKLDDELDSAHQRLTKVESDLVAHATRTNERHAELLAKLAKLDDGIHIAPRWVPYVLVALLGGGAIGAFGSNQLERPAAQDAQPGH